MTGVALALWSWTRLGSVLAAAPGSLIRIPGTQLLIVAGAALIGVVTSRTVGVDPPGVVLSLLAAATYAMRADVMPSHRRNPLR